MNRRRFLHAAVAGTVALPKAKVTRVVLHEPPEVNPLFNQSNLVVTVETDVGLVGVGEGGSKDTLEQCAVYPNKRPGLGVTLEMKQLKRVAEVTKPGPARTTYTRPDGSMTNW